MHYMIWARLLIRAKLNQWKIRHTKKAQFHRIQIRYNFSREGKFILSFSRELSSCVVVTMGECCSMKTVLMPQSRGWIHLASHLHWSFWAKTRRIRLFWVDLRQKRSMCPSSTRGSNSLAASLWLLKMNLWSRISTETGCFVPLYCWSQTWL